MHHKPKIQSLLIWSKDIEDLTHYINHIRDEFDEQIYPFGIHETPFVSEDIASDKLEQVIELYDFHVVKIYSDRLELILKNNERHEISSYNDLEDALEHIGRRILEYMRLYETDDHHH